MVTVTGPRFFDEQEDRYIALDIVGPPQLENRKSNSTKLCFFEFLLK